MIVLTLPIRTNNPLNNSQGFSRGATMVRARNRKTQRATTMLHVIAKLACETARHPLGLWRSRSGWVLGDDAALMITLTRIAPSSGLDDDALPASAKSVRDGIADALGMKSDRHPRVTWRYEQRRGKAKEYGVEVKIERRE